MTTKSKKPANTPRYREDNLCRDGKGRAWTSAKVKAAPAMYLSVRQISRLARVDRSYVEARLDNACEPYAGYKRGHPVWSIESAVRAFRQEPDKTDADLAEMKPHDRHIWLKGTLLKHQLEREAASLLTAEDVAAEVTRQTAIIDRSLAAIPDELVTHCGCTPVHADRVRRHLDQLRAALAPAQ